MKRVVFWGSGSRAEEARELLQGWEIEAVVDNNPKLQGQKWHGIPLISFSDFLAMEDRPILLVTPHFCSSILRQLQEAGVDKWVTYNDILAGDSAEGMTEEQLSFLYEAACLQLGKVKKLQHNYFYECFLRSGSREGRQDRLLQMCQAAKYPVMHYRSRSAADSVNILFGRQVELVKGRHLPEGADLLFTHSLYEEDYDAKFMELEAMRRGVPVILSDEGFLHSIEPVEQLEKNKFRQGHSLVLDMGGDYINAGSPSRIENILNSDWEMSQEERCRAERLIKTILVQKLSKYNSQKSTDFCLPSSQGVDKVLVVDQLYGDMSISYGQATDEMFSEMLGAALEENPEADIYVKAHPVKGKKHFAGYEDHPRVIWLEATMNPVALLEQMDKVYVCTSQLGFEALMCGKEVHVFGMPFYAGWGGTNDRQICSRRQKRRSVEEIFYAAYVFSTVYLSYRTRKVCEIEDVIDELLELRRKYLGERGTYI